MTGRSRGRAALAVVFALLALEAWTEVGLALFGPSTSPLALTALQAATGTAAAAAAIGSWSGAAWAPMAAALYGVVAAGMLLAVPPILALDPKAVGGVRFGAFVVFALGVASAWYLRRVLARERKRASD